MFNNHTIPGIHHGLTSLSNNPFRALCAQGTWGDAEHSTGGDNTTETVVQD